LLAHHALQDVSAIKNKRFVVLPLTAGAEGIRGSQALNTLARAFYPEKFE
jgi:iron complex transport system substrate-binding protein